MPRPQQNEYPPYFERYISLVEGESIAEVISKYNDEQLNYVDALPNDKANFAYAENKWTVKEAVQHISDTERVFAYRILAMSRGEMQTLTGFDQNIYAQNSNVLRRSFDDVKEEFKAVRYATNILLRSLSEEQLLRVGNVADYKVSAKAFAFNIYGHFIHHQHILKEKYSL
ncbi:DinB family protein [Arachidicoccus ginsenosidimutans]|uniref:DinB family protein n=1 Tax=Arachidicoccus sp. BS20 TaxID=1850526 RepID=UPI0009EDDF84|nr:DinB family protein [Arachidicoccus sp. BS20]